MLKALKKQTNPFKQILSESQEFDLEMNQQTEVVRKPNPLKIKALEEAQQQVGDGASSEKEF